MSPLTTIFHAFLCTPHEILAIFNCRDSCLRVSLNRLSLKLMIGHRMAKLTLYPYTSGSYLSAATIEYNEDPGPEH